MKRKDRSKLLCSFVGCILATLVLTNKAHADGTIELGPPSIPIASGSDVLVGGTGLIDPLPGLISIETPADAAIAQVLLYWTGIDRTAGDEDTVLVNGKNVTGPRIGGPADNTYRADITASNWVVAGAVNVISVAGLDFSGHNNGAAVVVILDDGSTSDIQILDGSDDAYLTFGWETTPVDFPVMPSAEIQQGTLWLVVSDIEVPRPAGVKITMGGVITLLDDVFLDNEGDYMDVVELPVLIPAGITNITVQPVSLDDVTDRDPASLTWNFVAWVLAEPPDDPPEGCTYTQGFWKNHPDAWPTNNLSLFDEDAMEIFWTKPKGGNAYIILAHQYIAAELNVVNGTSIPVEVLDSWYEAQDLLEQYEEEGTIPKKSSDRDWAIDLATILDYYNNGFIGPGHCD